MLDFLKSIFDFFVRLVRINIIVDHLKAGYLYLEGRIERLRDRVNNLELKDMKQDQKIGELDSRVSDLEDITGLSRKTRKRKKQAS